MKSQGIYEFLGYAQLVCEQYDGAIEAFKEAQRIFKNLGLEDSVKKEKKFIRIANKCKKGDAKLVLVLGSIDN